MNNQDIVKYSIGVLSHIIIDLYPKYPKNKKVEKTLNSSDIGYRIQIETRKPA